MATAHVLVRVWLPDRPGALGQVASRIGSLRGDIVGVDVLECDGGVAIDEFALNLADEELVPENFDSLRSIESYLGRKGALLKLRMPRAKAAVTVSRLVVIWSSI